MCCGSADVVIGPPCPEADLIMAHLSNVYKKAWLGWVYVIPDFLLETNIRSFLAVSAITIGACALQVVSQFKWDIIPIIYMTNEVIFCDDMIDSLMISTDSFSDASASFTPRVALKQIVNEDDNNSYTRTLQQIKARSRVTILRMDLATDRRGFRIRANQMRMTNSEYVFLMLNIRSTGFGRAGAGKEIRNNLTRFPIKVT
ncbi:unnamed protein product [Strongylus vulgaris]|uniref:Receptor ligand binding region domain-containing protein n=1 Tax=Strongylus vulgaris TaxID=40348 RepID=A0A3P7JN98_STRVU|nr:unnamed protein product [Strongylus vulgaris]